MRAVIQYFDGCPHWRTMLGRLQRLVEEGLEVSLELQPVATDEDAERLGFHGSPTLLIDGVDPFYEGTESGALSCRVYRTDEGLAGSPSLEQLRTTIMTHLMERRGDR